ncbi:MAG: GNAT family N-acetyltransferase [Saprospiraceae bacterium]|nr:GNAT family N-acetyltransferase [Saprospiraceae bacterium]
MDQYPAYTISVATPADIPALLPLINSAYRGAPSRMGWTTEADFIAGAIRTNAADLRELMGRAGALILKICGSDARPAGCVFLENRNGRLYLGMLSVWPEQQNAGIGKRLLEAAEKQAAEAGCSSVFMQVISLRTELIAWYERHGYRVTGIRKPFDGPPEFGKPTQPLEFLILEKRLTL